MTESIHHELKLTVEFDDDFRRQVPGSGRVYNPRVSLGIDAGDVSLSGPVQGYTGVYLTNFLGEALAAIESTESGDKKTIKTGDGPAYIVLEPRDDEAVVVTKCFSKGSAENPDERLPVEPHAVVTKEAFVEEVIRLANESLERILDANEDVRDHRQIRELQELLRTVEERR